MKNPPHQLSESEYESLPPALRRKYFSSLERLRLAKDGGSHPSPASRSKNPFWPPSSRPSSRRKSLFGLSQSPFQETVNPVRKRLRGHTAAPSSLVNPDNAAWFASLPPAVRRKHFSKEEQILFASERHSVILDAADELFQRRYLQESPLEPPPFQFPPRPQTSYFPDNADGVSFLDDTDSEEDEIEVNTENQGMANYSLDKFPWLEDEPDLDLRLDDYHAAIADTAQRQAAAGQRPPNRRNLSLSALSLRKTSVSSSHPNLSSLVRAAPTSAAARSSPLPPQSPTQHRSRTSISSIDPRATHYQDPTARMKLRVYLASPSKFDEAVEFGFPSLQDQGVHHERPKTSPRLTNESGRTFLTEDTPSLLGDDGSSHDDRETVLDPRTPEDLEFRINRTSKKNGDDRQSIKPQLVRNVHEHYTQSTTLDREMTIHMTLTRPDLRTLEDQTSNVNALPIEHCVLPHPENKPSIWDTLPDDESKVKKFWRRLKMK